MTRPEKKPEIEENKALYFQFATSPSGAGTEAREDILDPAFIDHRGPGRAVESLTDASLERRVVIEDVVAEGDRVAGRILVRWTKGEPHAGGTEELEFIEIVRVNEGRIVERWRQPASTPWFDP